MRYKRIFIIYPYYPGHGVDSPPAGLGYLTESLDANRTVYRVYDMNFDWSIDKLIKAIRDFKPDVIGLSLMSYRYRYHYELARKIKYFFPQLKIAAGGPHISFFGKEVLADCAEIDYGFVMEAEKGFNDLCCGATLGSIKGLIYRKNGQLKQNPFCEHENDLDALSFPRYKGFDLDRYNKRVINLLTSRGCPYNCIFCGHHLVTGKSFRFRHPAHIVDEIDYWVDRGYRSFNITDSNFSVDKERVYAICNEIEKRKLKVQLSCGDGIRADHADYRLLKRMRDIGFMALSLGVESASERILKNLDKGEKVEDIEKIIRIACDLGYDVTPFFVIGSPEETASDVRKSMELALKYPIFNAYFNVLVPYPGTRLYEWVKTNNYLLRDYREYLNDVTHISNDPVYQTPDLTVENIKGLIPLIEKTRRTILMRTIQRKLAGKPIWLGNVAARMYTSDVFQRVKNSNRLFQKISSYVTNRF